MTQLRTPRLEWIQCALAIGLGFGVVLAWQFRALIPTRVDQPKPHVSMAPSKPAGSPASTQMDVQADDSPPTAPASNEVLPLTLIDVSPGRTAFDGTARLGTDPHDPQTYSVGALLRNGSRLTQIHADHVVLERDGMSADLYVRDGKHPVSEAARRLLADDGRPDGQQHLTPQDAAVPSVTDYIRPNSVYVNDRLRGLALYPGPRTQFFSSSGLHAGDVVVAVDGVPVAGVDQPLILLEPLAVGATVRLSVERSGATKDITLDGSLVASPPAL